MSDEASEPQGNTDDDLEVIETVTAVVEEDGTVVVDDVVAVVGADGSVVAADETITVTAPDGTVVVDEVVSLADQDGHLVPIAEEAEIGTPRRRLTRPRLLLLTVAVAAIATIFIRSRRCRAGQSA